MELINRFNIRFQWKKNLNECVSFRFCIIFSFLSYSSPLPFISIFVRGEYFLVPRIIVWYVHVTYLRGKVAVAQMVMVGTR